VSQNYFQGRYGEVTLSVGGRMETPTNRYRPGSDEALALADENARRRIILDDGSSLQNPNPPFIGVDNTLRAGTPPPA
jgi:predicted extracellular nuclease